MTSPGANTPGGDRNKKTDLGGADAVPDSPHTAKSQGAGVQGGGLTEAERRLTPRATATATASSGLKPVVYIIIAIVAIAAAYFFLGMG